MTSDERERMLDVIREHSDHLMAIACAYDRLRWVAEKPGASEAILVLAKSAGRLVHDRMNEVGTMLDLLEQAFSKEPKQ